MHSTFKNLDQQSNHKSTIQTEHFRKSALGLCLALAIAIFCTPALFAATRCVSQDGARGCFPTISAAVAAATPGDVIKVDEGTYKEDVVINKPLSLVGQNSRNTIIDATSLANGVEIDGHDNPGLSHVIVTGFTVENANFSGILVSNASAVTISNNHVRNNDRNLASGTCPGLPGLFEPGEDLDCGEGIQLSGVDHSTFAGNLVEHNAGGILVADDTGATHDNIFTENIVQQNTPDCGITLASHSFAGVFDNTVEGNASTYNGGAGVGIFAGGPGNQAYSNTILNNLLTGNGLPGVTMHNHAAPGVGGVPAGAPAVVFRDNVIVGNFISKNAQDTADAATSGPTGINIFSLTPMPGTIVDRNTITDEALDVAIKIPAAAAGSADIQAHLNNLAKPVGIQNAGAATVDATENWWSCPSGPGRPGCSGVVGTGVVFNPWLTRPAESNQGPHSHRED
ncbi:MAG TPA: right-handed parallel beta-helix repeat-containing protein [Candidatus Angelobacter sp.]|nr:right-handed parallel beta-helix repeat-containing protein [Candidatus Angelobacter sp.]